MIYDTVENFGVGQTAISSTVPTKITTGPGGGQSAKGLQIMSLPANTGIIYIGKSDVTVSNGFPLSAGQGLLIPVHSVGEIFAISTVNAEKVAYLWG